MDGNSVTTAANLSGRESNVRYRRGVITQFTVGDGMELVYCKDTASAGLLPCELAALLPHCGTFRTIEEHARACCGDQNPTGQAMSQMQARLKELAERGFLISDRQVFETLIEPTVPRSTSVAIRSICFPTCNRVESLERCMQSYISNCRQYGKTNDYVVMDDSPLPEVRSAHRQMLATLRAQHDVNIKYAGWEEKYEFSTRLIKTKELPSDLVEFALFGDEESGLATYGANRNAILLHTIGETIFCTDDDTLCRIAAAPFKADGLLAVSRAYAPRIGPEETWHFPDRAAALNAANFEDSCLLDMHEQFLGKELGTCIAEVARTGLVDLDRTEAQFHNMLASGEGRIRVTLNGILGDCGWPRPLFHIHWQGQSLERLTRDESEYQALRISREFLRVVDRISISDQAPSQGMFLGLDNRDVLPPYLPVGKGEDILFGQVLSKCIYDTYYARLPWALLHDPLEPRSFSSEGMFSPLIEDFFRLIQELAYTLQMDRRLSDPKVRLRILGCHLEEIGRLPAFDFRELVCLRVWQAASEEVRYLEKAIELADESRQFWASDVKAYVRRRRDQLLAREVCMPNDLSERLDRTQVMSIAQQLVCRFGRLLQWWPDIVESARSLRAQGYTLAKPV